MSTENKDRFQMAVNYADGLQEVMVPVSFKAAMGGILAPGGKKRRRKKNDENSRADLLDGLFRPGRLCR